MNNAAKISAITLGTSPAGLTNAKRTGLPEPDFSEARRLLAKAKENKK